MNDERLDELAGQRAALDDPQFYRRLLETLAEGVCLSDSDGLIGYTNHALERIFGYAPGELNGRHISVLNGASAEENSSLLEAIAVELRRTGSWKGEWLNRRKSGERFYCKTHITSIELKGRSHWLAILEDVTDERLAADAVRDHETRLHLAAEAAKLGVWDWDLRTNAFVYSERAKEICGFPADHPVTFEDVIAVTHPEDYPLTWEQARLATDPNIRSSAPYRYRIVRRDGALRWLSAHGHVVFEEEDGAPARAVRYVGVIQDITESHDAEVRLRESEARFRAMADSTPAPAWVTNAAGKMVFANRAFAEVAGRPAEDLQGDIWIELLHPDEVARIGALRAKAWADGFAPYAWDGRFKDKNGQWRWMRVSAGPRFHDDGAFQGYVGIATDITEARQAQDDLAESERRLRLAIESSNAADWRWQADGDRLELSDAAAALIGITPSLNWTALRAAMNDANGRALQDTVAAGVASRKPWEVELFITRPDTSQKLWVAVRGQALFAEDGALSGMIGLMSDISDRKEREERERLLLREVDHRAKNVLAVAQALARLTPFNTKDQYLSDFVGRIGSLGLVHGLLSKNRWSHIDLRELIEDELVAAQGGGAEIEFDGAPLPIGPSIAQPLSMIVHELATNAMKHGALTRDGGRLKVSWTTDKAGRVTLDWLEASDAHLAQDTASGFGTILIESAVRQIHGEMRKEWGATGLRVQLSFDRGASGVEAFAPMQSPASVPMAVAEQRVLIVEDEPLVAMDLKMIVEASQRTVIGPAHSVEEALALVVANDFDCALLDVNLGGRHIAPVLEALTQRARPYALVTGYEDPGLEGPIIHKPVTAARVHEILARLTPAITPPD